MPEAPRITMARRNEYVVEIRPAENGTWPDFTFSDWRGQAKTIRPSKISFVLAGPGDTYYGEAPAARWQLRDVALLGYEVLRSGAVGKRRASAHFSSRLEDMPAWAADLARPVIDKIQKEDQQP